MICPACSCEIDDNTSFCQYCGAKIQSETSPATNTEIVPITDPENSLPQQQKKALIINTIYAICLLIAGGQTVIVNISYFLKMFAELAAAQWLGFTVTAVLLASTVVSIMGGIGLLRMKRFGLICANVINIYNLVIYTVVFLIGCLMLSVGVVGSGEYSGFGYIFAFFFFIFSVPMIVISILLLIYYRKNKLYFVN